LASSDNTLTILGVIFTFPSLLSKESFTSPVLAIASFNALSASVFTSSSEMGEEVLELSEELLELLEPPELPEDPELPELSEALGVATVKSYKLSIHAPEIFSL
jgi:hypothetical protein